MIMPATRAIWKGHVSFGLVNIPITLYSAEQRNDIHFHLLDSRDSQRVRYQRVNEETGEEVPWDQIVKGYEYDDQGYVLLSDDEMKEVRAEMTRQIEIEDFVDQEEIDPVYFDKPYYLEPGRGGNKAYGLLRTTMQKSQKIGIARVVIRAREHLAALMVRGDYLVLELLRFPQELRDPKFLEVPDESIKLNKREQELAMQLVENMSSRWEPEKYHDEYRESLMEYIEEKVKRGEMSTGSDQAGSASGDEDDRGTVVDLMDYLKRSVEQADKPAAKKTSAKKASKKKASKKKSARKGTGKSTTKKKQAGKKASRKSKRKAS